MPKILSVSSYKPPYTIRQEETARLTKELFKDSFTEIERLMRVFQNGEIHTRHFCVPMEWFEKPHSFEERNELYIDLATRYGVEAINACLQNQLFLTEEAGCSDIDAIFFVSSSGISTPSIDARIMNHLPFSDRTKRIPIWGLGCAGGASGVSRAFDYCLGHPDSKVLVVCVELCSLTFQRDDRSKSNLIGASLFADGVACALICGDEVKTTTKKPMPSILSTASKWMPDSEDVMGWDVKNNGLHVVFSKDIPTIIRGWLGPFVHEFLAQNQLQSDEITHFVAHPGGKKVLDAYEKALGYSRDQTNNSREVLINNGNMSSPTVLYVLEEFMKQPCKKGDYGLMTALGPGFSGELLLLKWD
ncbi:type III polyketide synthase [Jeotgalibacillus sp. S-D1]|uniref:type III polyketide synthase n=1 Tax=Jeotgalibacillus sp. S-D1 TaxID=2552189 RepID=UPI001059DCFD|nr:3-oxoacyl-[acyl-carrier-protein] synthase III C-terminal domain-containing protein [Jeotgalibacillus sp. S-D1]TDL33103.1 type III polyketide synthase [Jeotgalibacillus sp. S-D1]